MPHRPKPASLLPPLPPHAAPLPPLETLFDYPTWCNVAGRIDRAACCELPVSAIWRRAIFPEKPVDSRKSTDSRNPTDSPKPSDSRRWAPGREAAAHYRLTAIQLEHILRSREPRKLMGDFRYKSNAMQPTNRRAWDRDKRWRTSLKSLAQFAKPTPEPINSAYMDHGLTHNPNKGAAREKILGLDSTWEQELRVERWVQGRLDPNNESLPPNLVGNENVGLRRNFLVCPGKAMKFIAPVWVPHPCQLAKRERNPKTGGDPLQLTPRQRDWFAVGREPYRERCSGKAYKLFMPMCTPAEQRDALAARQWVETYRALNPRAPGSELEALLIMRYSLLWPPRVLLCAKCLGLKYGKVRFERRAAGLALPAVGEHGQKLTPWEASKRVRAVARKAEAKRKKNESYYPPRSPKPAADPTLNPHSQAQTTSQSKPAARRKPRRSRASKQFEIANESIRKLRESRQRLAKQLTLTRQWKPPRSA